MLLSNQQWNNGRFKIIINIQEVLSLTKAQVSKNLKIMPNTPSLTELTLMFQH